MRKRVIKENALFLRKSAQFIRVVLSLMLLCGGALRSPVSAAASNAANAPVLLSEATSTRAVALDSVTFKREPFAVNSTNNFSADGRTRVMLFVMNPGLLQGESAGAVTADAEDYTHTIYPLRVEYAAPVPGYEWMSEVVVRLNDNMGDVGDVLIRVNIHGVASNRVRIGIGHITAANDPNRIPDDAGSVPTPAPAPPAPQPTPYPTPNSYTGPASVQDTVRFLEQSTFGATPALISHVQQIGFKAFLDEQFNAPVSQYPALTPPTSLNQTTFCGSPNQNDPNYNPNYAVCIRDNFTQYPNQVAFFKNALYGQDQLRQRVAFALSQILVTSGVGVQPAYAMREYQQMLMNDAFGNYRQILNDVTLSPMMGAYLDMANNRKAANGVQPNENYARELLQLFSIGTVRLNQDGTSLFDQQGREIPTYDQNTISNFARVMTGFTYPTAPGATPRSENPPYYIGAMLPNPTGTNYHDTGPKELLNGVVLPGGQSAQKDLSDTLDNVFNHPNVAPFICKQLIQHLVTSNPSPAYVGRVSAVFNNNGAGVRGDMKAVITAILLDPEARGDVKTDPNYGKLREPVLFVTNFLRAFNPTSDGDLSGGSFSANGNGPAQMGENVFNSPTVFNYFPPDYQLPGNTILAPEFAIQTTAASFTRANFINTMVYSRIGTAPNGTSIDLSAVQALATDTNALINYLDNLMTHGTLTPASRAIIAQTVNSIAINSSNPEPGKKARAQTAVYLIATSSEYQIER
jgi:uncharacterized protein (DUF1800 family)